LVGEGGTTNRSGTFLSQDRDKWSSNTEHGLQGYHTLNMNLPNRITSLRMIIVITMIVILLWPYSNMPIISLGETAIPLVYLIAGSLFLIASITDFLDGYLARKLNLITNLGKFLDPLADKILTNSAFILLMITPSWLAIDIIRIPAWVVILMIIRDLVIDGIRMIGVSQGRVIAANRIGKVKTFLQIIAILLVFFNDWPFAWLELPVGLTVTDGMLYLAAITAFASLWVYLISNWSIFRDAK
jgi:CDP-diacylglycerol---glycerol-3-phosphate 3-phosphatidyltransferase